MLRRTRTKEERKVLKAAIKHAKERGCGVIRMAFLPGVTAGWPDTEILVPGGRPLFIETKAEGEEPTPIQKHRLGELQDLGYAAVVVDSVEDAKAIIDLAVKLAGR